MVRMTASRWLGSASSKSKRILEMRSEPVCVEQATMFTWCSADGVRHVPQQLRPVERLHLDRGDERALAALVVPLDLDHAGGLGRRQRHGVGAVGPVHADAAAAGDEPDDLVARHRRAAPREPHHHVVEALDVHADGALGLALAPRRAHRDRELLLLLAAAERAGRAAGRPTCPTRGARRWPAPARRGRCSSAPSPRAASTSEASSFCTGRPSRRSSLISSSRPLLHGVVAALTGEPLADLVAGPG